MKSTDDGVPVGTLVATIKDAVKQAGVSRTSDNRDMEVASIQLILKVVAIKSSGGRLSFRVPVVGMNLGVGAKITKNDVHTVDITLIPPNHAKTYTVRSGNVEQTLVDAISTIRDTISAAAEGDDPWVLSTGTIDISFVVTRTGAISLGVDGELTDEINHTLRLGLTPIS